MNSCAWLQWSDQGVLLLNAALTVRAHEANSHAKKGWQELTSAAIKALSAKRRGLVFLLWGKNAQVGACSPKARLPWSEARHNLRGVGGVGLVV